MHAVIVYITVKPECIQEFIEATRINAANSVTEPGVVQFDFLQEKEKPERFVLYEIYYSKEDQLRHRETYHYLTWKDHITEMMAEPRVGVSYTNLFPTDQEWKK